ncbi:MAG: hypothetical protein P4L10_15870 [Acidobacteriaceae bacterium]|nr:hypothetical protein [Acidobacteriaceae bacterium]
MANVVTGSPPTKDNALSPEQAEVVRKHLQAIVDSSSFANSKRTQSFLRLIVTRALQGDLDSLHERMIGAELFGRPLDYDTGSDSVVRVRASEVRKKLAQYYREECAAQQPPVRIELPSGSYVPRFHFLNAQGESLEAAGQGAAARLAGRQESVSAASADTPAQRRSMPIISVIVAISCVLLVAVGFFGFQRWQQDQSTRKGIRSIAILPLKNLSGDPAQDYFADGMTEELINDLGQVSTVRVISLTSSMSYKGTKKTLPEIARELSVEGVVEGGVLRDGNQVRISAQLIDALSDRPIWAQTYVRNLSGATAWQGEIAQAIAEEIRTKVTPQEQARLSRSEPVDPQAQDLYLHGILLRNNGDCPNAVGYFDKAIARSPSYAKAHSALASCYGMMGETGHMNYQDAFSRQKREAQTAIALDDSLSEAHAELANTAMTLDWNWSLAQSEFQRALTINPSSATNHEKYAFYLVRTGKVHDALTEVEHGVDLDPVSGSSFHSEGFIYYFSRQYDQALEVARTGRGLKINLYDWNLLLGAIYAEKNMYRESIGAFLAAGEGPYIWGHLGNAYARAGQESAARQEIARLQDYVSREGIGRYEIALVYAGLGEKSKAFEWLEDAYRAHDVGLVYLKVDPCLDSLRSDPRFKDLLRRVGLAEN